MKILFLSRWFPFPPSNGSKLRIYHLIRGLAQQHEVTLISFTEGGDGEPEIEEFKKYCARIYTVPWKKFDPNQVSSKLDFLSLTPRLVQKTYSTEIEQHILSELNSGEYAAIIASQFDMAMYAAVFENTPALYEEAEIGTYYDQYIHAPTLSTRLRHWLTWWKHKRYIRSLMDDFAACTVVSKAERDLMQSAQLDSTPITVLPNCVDVASYATFHREPEANTLVFTGSFTYAPNYEAMVWFTGQVLPILHREVPDLIIRITGEHARHELPYLKQVEILGFVQDIRPLVARSYISLAPIHHGGGTRIKILEAMALKTPVVATSKGAEGLDVNHEEHLLIADTPQEFSQACLRLLHDRGLRQHLTRNAYQLVKTKYNWPAVIPDFLDLVEMISRN
jgi:glycosyltransferase involved in cell wall biosynthesis